MDPALLHACDANLWLADALFFGASPQGEVTEVHDLHLTSCGFPTAEFNRAFLKKPEGDLPAVIARAEAHFARLDLPFFFTARSDWMKLSLKGTRVVWGSKHAEPRADGPPPVSHCYVQSSGSKGA